MPKEKKKRISKKKQQELRKKKFKHWIKHRHCCRCWCGNDECMLGYARNGKIMCQDCNDNDPVLSSLKWEDLESCYMTGAIGGGL